MFLPSINQEGVYTLKAPFDALYKSNVIYKCESVRSIKELLSTDIDPYETYYAANGISHDVFTQDVQDGVSIVSLWAHTGVWVRVPSSFIEKAPEVSGTRYTPIVVNAFVGYVRQDLNFEQILEDVKGVISTSTGITPEVVLSVVGPSMLLSDDKMAMIENSRAAQVQEVKSPHLVVKEQTETIRQQQATIDALNKYIRDNA